MTQQRREVESEERRYNCAKVSRKKNTAFRDMICGWAGSKSNLGKAAGAEVAVERRHEKLHAAVARSTFSIKMCLSLHVRTTFGSSDVEKLHAAVARSTFSSQNRKKLTVSDHFFEVQMWKNCTPLWRETHFQVKMYKTPHGRTTF